MLTARWSRSLILTAFLGLAVTVATVPNLACATGQVKPSVDAVQATRLKSIQVAGVIERVGAGVEAAQMAEIALRNAAPAMITDADHKEIQTVFLAVAQNVRKQIPLAEKATSDPQLRSTLRVSQEELAKLPAAWQRTHPTARTVLTALVAGLSASIDVALMGP